MIDLLWSVQVSQSFQIFSWPQTFLFSKIKLFTNTRTQVQLNYIKIIYILFRLQIFLWEYFFWLEFSLDEQTWSCIFQIHKFANTWFSQLAINHLVQNNLKETSTFPWPFNHTFYSTLNFWLFFFQFESNWEVEAQHMKDM